MSGLTRGPLPARVYWTRRVMVLGTAVVLVFGIARALGAGSDASSQSEPRERARQVAAVPTTTLGLPELSPTATEPLGRRSEQKQKKEVVPLATPEGTCEDEDVAVTPTVDHPVAGRDVRIVLELRTIVSEACTWEVSPEALTLKITSGKDEIWTSRHCPRAVPDEEVTLRREHTTRVDVTWDARRSDEECSKLTKWALPGWYHVAAAALAGEPSDLQFELERPDREHVTKTVEPKPKKKRERDKSRR
jgi:hypothetical protein